MTQHLEQLKKANALINEARKVEQHYKHKPESHDSLILIILTSIPLFNRLFKRLNNTSSSIAHLNKNFFSSPALNPVRINPIVDIALNVLDFVQIPLLYLAAYALGQKSPVNLTNNTKWLFTSIALSLCLTAFFVPAIAPFIAITSASIGFIGSAVVIGQLLYQYYQDKKSLETVQNEINNGIAGELQQEINNLEMACLEPDKNTLEIDELITKIESIKQLYDTQRDDIKALYEQKFSLEDKLKIETELMDNCAGIMLSSLAIAGTVVALFFPPTGFFILFAATLVGIAYVTTRIIAPDLFKVKLFSPQLTSDKECDMNHQEDIKNDSTGKLLNALQTKKTSSRSNHKKMDLSPSHQTTTADKVNEELIVENESPSPSRSKG